MHSWACALPDAHAHVSQCVRRRRRLHAGETLPPLHHGLSAFGERLLKELNRLGIMADLSHTSDETTRDVIRLSKAPVFFSHSGARGVTNHVRNVPDDILDSLKNKEAIVMVPFLYVRALARASSRAHLPAPAPQLRLCRRTGQRNRRYSSGPRRVHCAQNRLAQQGWRWLGL